MYKDVSSYSVNTTSADVVKRDAYDAIVNYPAEIKDLVAKVKDTAGWQTGITSEGMKRGGYESRNIDVYGYDVSRNLAVVQLRRAWKKKESWYTEVSKVYALVGKDDGQIFSHPLTSSPRRNPNLADMSPEEVVRWAESKIFGVPVNKLHTIIRQGDIALVPVRGIPSAAKPSSDYLQPSGVHEFTVRDSHRVIVDGDLYIDPDGRQYVDGTVEVVHVKDEHRPVSGTGKFRLVVGQRAADPWWIDAAMGD